MHTCGEPTRIVIGGYPDLSGTLLEQRAQAKAQHDQIRRRLILEPRGHYDMYGAILRPETEHTQKGEADIGVLFMTNDGYSTMCGHATIALGRFLVDTHDLNVFPNRDRIQFDHDTATVNLKLHAPCGVLDVKVPATSDGRKSDPSRPVSFQSVPCFATGINVKVSLKPEERWPELGDRTSVTVDFGYGGAFYCLISAEETGFSSGLAKFDLDAMNQATKKLKAAVNSQSQLSYLFKHPQLDDLSFLYSIIVTDTKLGKPLGQSKGAETGLCFFSEQEIDRSPTGSGVSARLAVAHARGQLQAGDSWTYHSLVSLHGDKSGAFVGTILPPDGSKHAGEFPIVRLQVEGRAFYTGSHTFVLEEGDSLGDGGFTMRQFAGS